MHELQQGDPESREHPRARARVKVEYNYGSTTGVGHTNDISESGLFLECDKTARAGTRIYLRLHLPGSHEGEALKIIGVVTREIAPATTTADDAETGMGIHFDVAYSRTREALSDLMETLLVHAVTSESQPPPTPIKRLPGTEAGGATYAARFPSVQSGAVRQRTLRPSEVDKVFAFRSELKEPGVDWERMTWLAVKLLVAFGFLALFGYAFLEVFEVFSGR